MPRPTVVIGCRLPNGLTISHPNPEFDAKATIAGLHSSKIIGATYVTTDVDLELWDAWKVAYRDYAPLKSGAIFEAKSEQEAQQKAKERAKEKTGFEGMSKDAQGVSRGK